MLEQKLNFFWKKILLSECLPISSIERDNISGAVCAVYEESNNDIFAFRSARELVDLNNKFKIFEFKNKIFVGKIINSEKAKKEYNKAKHIHELLNDQHINNKTLKVIIPSIYKIDNDKDMLVTEYNGTSLHEQLFYNKKVFKIKDFFALLDLILKKNVDWSGYAPRNMFIKDDKILLIDFEDANYTYDTKAIISDITIFKLKLSWASLYGKSFLKILDKHIKENYEVFYLNQLDNFEQSYSHITNISKPRAVRKICEKITLDSEVCYNYFPSNNFTFFEFGHLIDDLFPNNISLFYSCIMSNIRKVFGDKKFFEVKLLLEKFFIGFYKSLYVQKLTNAQVLEELKITLITIIIAYIDNPKIELNNIDLNDSIDNDSLLNILSAKSLFIYYVEEYIKSLKEYGLESALQRSFYAENILNILFTIIKNCFHINEEFCLLIRGSLGQGIITCKSDIDFEISNDNYYDGQLYIEQLIIDILQMYSIPAEGSRERPKENDIRLRNNTTRDFHEWTQLRKPLNSYHDAGWLIKYFKQPSNAFWLKDSIYFLTENSISIKILFLKIRDKITRLAFYTNCKHATIYEQLNHLKLLIEEIKYLKLYSLLEDVIESYEKKIDLDLNMLNMSIESTYDDILNDIKLK